MKLMDFNKTNNVNTILILPEKLTNNPTSILTQYLLPLGKEEATKVLVVGVEVPDKGAVKKSTFLSEWEQIQELIDTYQIKNVGIANADYLKFLLQAKKKPSIEREIGSVKKINGLNITPVLNYLAVVVSPNKKHLLQKSIDTLRDLINGTFVDNREEFVKSLDIKLCKTFDEAYNELKKVIDEPVLAIDIEATGLKWYQDELLTISFSKDETSGFCIPLHKQFTDNPKKMKKLIKKFFESYKGTFVLHNAVFDIPFLVYNLWMDDYTDTENMIKGVNYFNIDDSMVMAYLCLNNVDRPKLGLKELAYNKYGNWDKDIDQSQLINFSFDEVGKYNTIDTMATMYIYNRYKKMLVDEEQDELYYGFYKRLLKAIIKTKMNGLTIDKKAFENMKQQFEDMYKENLDFLNSTEQVKETVRILKEQAQEKGKKQREIDKIEFNPKSVNHLRVLLFDVMGFEPTKISKKSNEPSTDKEVIDELLKQTEEDSTEYKIIFALQEIGQMKTVKSTFVDGLLEKYVVDKKGNYKVFGDVNITGTLSGRFSSSRPNLQNLPSNSRFGKLIKQGLIAEKGYLIATADYSALEDRMGANVTGDPNKIRIFTEGIDGHSLAACYYFKDELERRGIKIDLNDKDSINSIKELAPDLRQIGKRVTFGANYGATEHAVSRSLKINKEEAKKILDNYWKLYSKTKEYWDKVEKQVLEKGYVTGAFGLKARGNLAEIHKADVYSKQLRSLVNMTIQSFALLLYRTLFMLQERIEKAGLINEIKIYNTVYDAIYIYVKPEPKIVKWLNDNLIELMLYDYDKNFPVKNEAELEIGKNQKDLFVVPNNVSENEIKEILKQIKGDDK